MPVTNSTPPPQLAFSKNHIIVDFESDDVVLSAGSYAETTITFGGTINPGDEIILKWSLANVVLTAAAVPDQSGFQFPSGVTNPAYVANLVAFFQSNFYIDRDFLATHDPTHIILTSREKGFNFRIADSVSGVPVTTINGTSLTYKPNFRHFLQVWIKDAVDIAPYTQALLLDPPDNVRSSKDIADILNTYLDYDIPDMQQVWQICTRSIRQYYFKYAQSFGDKPIIQKVRKSDIYTVCLGGYSELALGVMSDPDEHLQKYLLPAPMLFKSQNWFETYPVEIFDVKTNQPQFLYFINMHSVQETLNIQLKLYFSNGEENVVIIPGGPMDPLEKVCIGCGYSQLNLNAYKTPDKYVIAYDIKLIEDESGESRSVSKSFIVNREFEEFTRYILFGDSAGNFKTLRTGGRSLLKAQMSDSQAIRMKSLDSPKTGSVERYDVRVTKTDELHTGYLTLDQMNDLEELQLSTKAFRVFGDNLVPIVISSEELELEEDEKNFFNHKIEYRLAYDERLFTGRTGALAVPQLYSPTNPIID